jgi:hypothetical protein
MLAIVIHPYTFLALPAGLLFALCILGNWLMSIAIISKVIRGDRSHGPSLVLVFIAPILGIVFFLTVPVVGAARLWWLVLSWSHRQLSSLSDGFVAGLDDANGSPTTTTIKMVAGDTFLPVLKVPKAIFQATVKF